jgi:DNA-binding beta-propeller fold protein YncE
MPGFLSRFSSSRRRWPLLLLLLLLLLAIVVRGTLLLLVGTPVQQQAAIQPAIQHYLYVLSEDGKMYVYDMDHGHALVKTIGLPSPVPFIRGVGAVPASHSLYISYGSVSSHGQLMKLDLLTNQVIYIRTMPKGIDSFDITPDGKTIYMPDGDGQSDGVWRVVDAATGDVLGLIDTGGHDSHNTIVSLSGSHAYMGPRLSNYLVMADTSTNQIIRQIGPVQNGVRPFTINSKETLAFIETSGFIGFDVADINSGKILYTVPVPGYTYDPHSGFAPSHGISLSPDEKELYISDWPHSLVHVFDVAGLPSATPRLIASIKVHNMVGNDTPCVQTNCMKEGWVLHSRNGRFVYIGDAGDVIDTATRQSIAFLPPLANTRKFIEIDWRNGLPITTTTRYGKGYAGIPTPPLSQIPESAQPCIYRAY